MTKGISRNNELIISRRELQNWYDNLCWLENGSIIINTQPTLTLLKPKFPKTSRDSEKDESTYLPLKDIFKVESFNLENSTLNKFDTEVDTFGNTLLNADTESYIKHISTGKHNYLALLTNHYNILIYNEKMQFIANLDIPSEPNFADAQSFYTHNKSRIFHSMTWTSKSLNIIVGNECGDLVLFDEKGVFLKKISVSQQDLWVMKIVCSKNDRHALCTLSDNSVVLCDFDTEQVVKVKEASRFQIHDLQFVTKGETSFEQSFLAIVDTANVYVYDISNKTLYSCSTSSLGYDEKFIVLKNDDVYIFSSRACCRLKFLKDELELEENTDENVFIHSLLQRKLEKFNNTYNSKHEYETYMNVFGFCTSRDGSALAVLYYPEVIAMKYNILSESQFKLSLVPLNADWSIKSNAQGSGFFWYQLFNLYGLSLPSNYQSELELLNNKDNQQYDTSLEFSEYLKKYVLLNNLALKFQTFIGDGSGFEKVLNLYCDALYQYAKEKVDSIDNLTDIFVLKTVAIFLNKPDLFENTNVEFTMKSEFISQSFVLSNAHSQDDKWALKSSSGYVWKRCGISFLPLLSTDVKLCPITNIRIIDVSKDDLNDYGWFTKTILSVLGQTSIYSDVEYV